MNTLTLNGITWGHSRGYTPLMAYAQRFSEKNPGVEVVWKKRSLQEFADFPIEKLTEHYDLLVIDHPWVGCAAATNCVLPLDEYLPAAYLADQAGQSVGASHESYFLGGHQWALAIDAATPVSSCRADLFRTANIAVPQTWEDVLALARKGKVAVPAIPIDSLMNFYTFCLAHGQGPFRSEVEVIDDTTGKEALQTMRDLYAHLPSVCFTKNPIQVAEAMSTGDDYWYCPFAYGYSNYARAGYVAHPLTYGGLVSFGGQRLRSTLGGTGLAVSSHSKQKGLALQFAQEIVSAVCQQTFYVEHGGQPGYRAAWTGLHANSLTNNYFSSTLQTLDESYLRPRYNGYLHFQDAAGAPVQHYLQHGGNEQNVLVRLNRIYRRSRADTQKVAIHD